MGEWTNHRKIPKDWTFDAYNWNEWAAMDPHLYRTMYRKLVTKVDNRKHNQGGKIDFQEITETLNCIGVL